MNAFLYRESALVDATGIALKVFQRSRMASLKQGEDWATEGLHVVYAKNGLAKILELATGEKWPAEKMAALEKRLTAPAPEKTAPVVEGKVCKFYPNPKLLGVQLPDRLVNILVQTTKNFRRGMAVPIRCLPNDRYELARRLPRFQGRW